jgi:putative MATE family efflux protein
MVPVMSNPAQQEISGIFEGPILPVTIKLGLPILLSNLLNFFYNIVDTVFISMIDRKSTALLSGTGIVFPVFFLFLALASGLGVGMSTLVARSIGERNMDALRHGMASGFLLSLAISVVTIPLGYIFIDNIFALLAGKGMSPEAIGYGTQYFQWVLPGLAIMVFGQVLMGILQGEGKTRHIAVAMIISTLANIGLDPLFIFTFRMGVAGAAAATTASIAIAGIYVLFVFLSGRSAAPLNLNPFAARPAMMRQILAIGFPQSLGMLALSIAFMALNKLVSGIGEAEMTAWSIVGRVDQLVFIPIFAISVANATIIGQNYGRRNLARLLKVNDTNLLASILIIMGLSVLYILGAPILYRAFSSVEKVLSLSVTQVRWLSFTFIGIAGAIICGGTFQGTGTPLPALVITLLRIGLISVPLSCLFVLGFGWGMPGIWAALGASNLASLPLSWLWSRHHLRHLKFRSVEG